MNEHVSWENRTEVRKIFDRFYLSLCSFAYRYLQDDTVTEDVVQDAFLKLWERRKNFDHILTVKSFLYLTVRNACLDYLKHREVQARHEERVVRALLSEEEVSGFILEDEVYALLYEALNGLPERSMQIVKMTMEGLGNEEIATQLQISVNTVKSLKLRAYRVLREKLKGVRWILALLPLLGKI